MISRNITSKLNKVFIEKAFPEISLKTGTNSTKRPTATIMEIKLIKKDSVINWAISAFFSEPKVLRIPTSLALSDERAVDRFIKLTPAMNKIKKATKTKM